MCIRDSDETALRGEEQSVVGAAHQVPGDGERQHLGLDGEAVGAQCRGDRRGHIAARGVEAAGAQLDDRAAGDLGERVEDALGCPGVGGGSGGGQRGGGHPDAEHRGPLPRRRAQLRQHRAGVRRGGVGLGPAGAERGFRTGELGAGAVGDAAHDRQDAGGCAAFGPQAQLTGEGRAERSRVQRHPADAVLDGEAGGGHRDRAQMSVLGGVADHGLGRDRPQRRGHRVGAPLHHVQGEFARAAPALYAEHGRDP